MIAEFELQLDEAINQLKKGQKGSKTVDYKDKTEKKKVENYREENIETKTKDIQDISI